MEHLEEEIIDFWHYVYALRLRLKDDYSAALMELNNKPKIPKSIGASPINIIQIQRSGFSRNIIHNVTFGNFA